MTTASSQRKLLTALEPVTRATVSRQRAHLFQHQTRVRQGPSPSAARAYRPSPFRSNEPSLESSPLATYSDFIPFDFSTLRNPPLKTITSTPSSKDAVIETEEDALVANSVGRQRQSDVNPESFEPEIRLRGGVENLDLEDELQSATDAQPVIIPPAQDTTSENLKQSSPQAGRRNKVPAVAAVSSVATTKPSTILKRKAGPSKVREAPRQSADQTHSKDSTQRNPRTKQQLTREDWQIQKDALKQKFKGQAWNPPKKVSPDAMEGMRALHAQHPGYFTTSVLAKQFEVSPEAVRRILKSKWRPGVEQEEKRRERWDKRGERIWTDLSQKGFHPPKKWREMGIGGGPRYAKRDLLLKTKYPKVDTRKDDPESTLGDVNWLRSFASRVG